tara:strand:- start:14408 stop:15601 length:1194 start_codon:yes stop_codon:yes gene_type:complete
MNGGCISALSYLSNPLKHGTGIGVQFRPAGNSIESNPNNMNSAALENWATWQEIHAQPAIWESWADTLDVQKLRAWVRAQNVTEVWFCGAGTSAYIGDIICAGLEGQSGLALRAVATTDLVSRPRDYLSGKWPLVVSFGRSGNSTESIGTLDALDALAPDAPRLNITCNKDGALAVRPATGAHKVVVLPDACHDRAFAMTSSFSTMLLTALAVFDQSGTDIGALKQMAKTLREALPRFHAALPAVPARAVFVGAGPLAFAAREAALKVMELSAGAIPALWDSTLGFRHGPKSFVTDDTLITVFLSHDADTVRYDLDLAQELRHQFPKAQVITIGAGGDIGLDMPNGDTWGAPLAIAFAQVAGVFWSTQMGLDVDDPFVGRSTLSRVVSGVQLYPVTP